MGLFQPTNVLPSLWGELGDGVVDVANNIPVSWQVNGDVPMTAYQIQIYKNNAASTLVRDTGKVTLADPFYGVDYAGNIVRFSVSVAPYAYISNGNEYKMKITQWWGSATDDEKVVQASMSAFITRAAPTLTLGTITSPITSRSATFTATYTQSQGDSLNYVRWKLLWSNNSEQIVLKDTGNLYGVSELKFVYDGFFNGYTYIIYCEIQTQNGVVKTASQGFTVQFTTQSVGGDMELICERDLHGVKVTWPFVYDIPGTISGTSPEYYEFVDDALVLKYNSLSTLEYDTVNNVDMAISGNWTAICNWDLAGQRQGNDKIKIFFDNSQGSISLSLVNRTTGEMKVEAVIDGLTYTLSPRIGLRLTGTLMMAIAHTTEAASAAYTGEYKFMLLLDGSIVINFSFNTTGDGTLCDIVFTGAQTIKCFAVVSGVLDSDTTLNPYFDVQPDRTPSTILLTHFSDSTLEAGNYDLTSGTVNGYELYRQDNGDPVLKKIVAVGTTKNSVVDCSVPSQDSAVYSVFVTGSANSSALLSETLVPVFWDWAILSCTEASDGTYRPQSVFLFGKNLDSGSIGNNNSPNILHNFTQFPTIQKAPQNYMSGTLSSYIGTIDSTTTEYSDTLTQRDAINALSTTENVLFLKNRKGDVFPIQIAGAISFTTLDGSKAQALSVSIPWVQTGEIGDDSIILLSTDALYPTE